MKKNVLKYLPLLMMSPLLVANSPAPYPSSSCYDDIKVDCKFDAMWDLGRHYNVTIENTGDNYVLLSEGFYEDGGLHFSTSISPFKKGVIAPHKTIASGFVSKTEDDFEDENIVWHAHVYDVKDENATFSDFAVKESRQNSYSITFKSKGVGDYYYALIVGLEYDGEEYFIECDYSAKSKNSSGFNTYNPIDLDKLEVKSVAAYRSNYKANKGWGSMLIIFALVLSGVLLIPPAIIVPIILTKGGKETRSEKKL